MGLEDRDWLVERGQYRMPLSMALDEVALDFVNDESSEGSEIAVLRVYSLEEPAVALAYRTSYSDVKEDSGVDKARRMNIGSSVYCPESCVLYSITLSHSPNVFPDKLFEQEVGPGIAAALEEKGFEDVEVGVEHYDVRYGDRETLDGIPDGLPLAANSPRKKAYATQFQGMVLTEELDMERVDSVLEVPPEQLALVEELPYLDEINDV